MSMKFLSHTEAVLIFGLGMLLGFVIGVEVF